MQRTSLRSLNLNMLPILQSLLTTLNVTRTAEQLHMSQSAVSDALAKLRIQFKDELLVRVGREMRPTALALDMQDRLDASMRSVEDLIQVQPFDVAGLERRFVVSTADSVMLALADALVEQLMPHVPRISVQFVDITFDVRRLLVAGEVDLLVVPSGVTTETAGLQEMALYEDTFVGIARRGHPAVKGKLTRAAYDGLQHISFRANHRLEESVETSLVGLRQRDVVRLPSFTLMPALVERSDAVALMQKRAAEHYVERYDIEMFVPPFAVPVVSHHAYWGRIYERDPAHRWFRQQLELASGTLG